MRGIKPTVGEGCVSCACGNTSDMPPFLKAIGAPAGIQTPNQQIMPVEGH